VAPHNGVSIGDTTMRGGVRRGAVASARRDSSFGSTATDAATAADGRFADKIEANSAYLAALEALEVGGP